jgi:methanogenic corrinoid protein MtbC1
MSTALSTADMVERNAAAIASHACEHLLTEHAEVGRRFGDEARQLWTEHLNQRAIELAAALEADDPQMFASSVAWSRTAMQARDITADDLVTSLDALRTGVREALQEPDRTAALECIDKAMQSLSTTQYNPLETTLDAGVACDRLALQYVQTVVAGNVATGIQLVLDAVSHGLPIYDAYLKVLLPAQQEVGRLWHLNELSISEEHLVSYTTQRVMALLSTRMPRKPDNGLTAIAGSVAGNIHDIGIRAISYLLEFEGWRTIYLGSDIPRAELPATIETFKADVILLSFALSSQIPAARRAIEEIRSSCKHPVKIMIGGNGLAGKPKLWQELNADAYATDAIQTIKLAHEIATR